MNCTPSQPCYPAEFYQRILNFLCIISKQLEPGTNGVRYDWEVLCDPNTGNPVLLRNGYNTDGTVLPVAAFTPAGVAYSGVIAQLVSCGGGGSVPGGPIRYVYELLCDSITGLPVLLRQAYNIDGTIIGFAGFTTDGSAYGGSIATLVACTAATGGTTRYDYEILCDPNTGLPVILRASYNINGTQNGFVAYTLAGTAYVGDITLLLSCAGGGSSVFNGWSWVTLCDPTTGQSVFVRITYNTSGVPTTINGFYGDLSTYNGNVYNLVSCESIFSGDSTSLTWNPNALTTTIISNPGVGMQTVQRNLISTEALGLNPFGYPFNCMNYRLQWKEIEDVTPGVYDLTILNQVCDDARAALQTLNLRILSYDPASGYSTPDYMYTNGGWQVTDSNGAGTFKLAWWGNAANITALLNLHTAVNAAIGTHPAFNVLDAGWGDFDENTYSGTNFNGTLTGGAPNPGVGFEIAPLSLAENQNFFNAFRAAYGPDRLIVTHADSLIAFNYAVGTLNMGSRMDGWAYRNSPSGSPGGCPGGGVQMCTNAVQTFLSTGSYPNQWKNTPNIQETYGRIYTGGDPAQRWTLTGWDITANFNWTWQQAHTSEINVKGNFAPPTTAIRTPFETMLNNLGYRFVLLSMTRPSEVPASSSISVKTQWSNVGTAPNYRNEVVSYRLYDPVSGKKFYYQSASPSSAFIPGSSVGVTTDVPVPNWFPECNAVLSVGLARPNPVITGDVVPDIRLANDGNGDDLWYSFPTSIKITNPSPSITPSDVFAATFNGINQSLSSTSELFRLAATDFVISLVVPAFTLGANRGFVTKGFRATAATQEFWIGYNSATDRIEASFSNGTTIYTAVANNFGAVSALPSSVYPLKILVEFNNTSKIIALTVNNSPSNTFTGTGSIPAGSNLFRIGSDSNNNFLAGQVTEVRIWHKLFTGLPASYRQMLLNPGYLRYADFPNQLRYGFYYNWEMTEVSGNRIDSNCGRALTSNNGVTRTALN